MDPKATCSTQEDRPKASSASISHFFRAQKRPRTTETDAADAHNAAATRGGEGVKREASQSSEVMLIDLLDDDEDDDESVGDKGTFSRITATAPSNETASENIIVINADKTAKENISSDKREDTPQSKEVTTGDNNNSPPRANPFAKFAAASSTEKEEKVNSNPFAKFAFGGATSLNNIKKKVSSTSNINSLRKSTTIQTTSTPAKKDVKKKKLPKDKCKTDFVRMRDLPPEEQERIVQKWHSMADPEASLEDRRFQVLVAARLHARCQESTTRKAMNALFRETFVGTSGSSSSLTVTVMAKADPDILETSITNLQYYSTKAKHLVKAAQQIQSQFGGQVPETEHSLKQITGIGPVFADLLAFVNTRARHQQQNNDPQNNNTRAEEAIDDSQGNN